MAYLAALRMGIRYCDRFCDMPYRSAWVITNVKGRNMPQKKQKHPATVTTNLGSLRGLMKFMIETSFFLCVNLDFSVRFEMPNMKRMRKAQIRIAHANPTCGIKCETMMGKITPPRLDPEAMMPSAKARRLPNQVLTELTQALKMALAPRGLQMPWERMNW